MLFICALTHVMPGETLTFVQVGLVAIYAATLPTRRRRDVYAAFLRGVEGDANRREALEQANSHMPGDVPAILKKVRTDRTDMKLFGFCTSALKWECKLVPCFFAFLFFA